MTTQPVTRSLCPPHPRALPVWGVALAAVVGAETVWTIAVALGGVRLEVEPSGGGATSVVGPGSVAVVAALAVLLAWPLRSVLARSNRGPHRRAWRLTCAIVLLVSLVGALGATTAAATATLVTMHVLVAAVIVVGLDPCRSAAAATTRAADRVQQ